MQCGCIFTRVYRQWTRRHSSISQPDNAWVFTKSYHTKSPPLCRNCQTVQGEFHCMCILAQTCINLTCSTCQPASHGSPLCNLFPCSEVQNRVKVEFRKRESLWSRCLGMSQAPALSDQAHSSEFIPHGTTHACFHGAQTPWVAVRDFVCLCPTCRHLIPAAITGEPPTLICTLMEILAQTEDTASHQT